MRDHRTRRRPGWPQRLAHVARAAALAAAVLAGTGSAANAAPDGAAPPVHGPVTPPQFGFYGTRWRRWNITDGMSAGPGDTPATPAGPPRSVVPDARDESLSPTPPAGEVQPLPGPRAPDAPARQGLPAPPDVPARPGAPAAEPRPDGRAAPPAAPGNAGASTMPAGVATLPQSDPQATARFLERVSREAVAAKTAGSQAQAEFTQQLVGELLSAHDPEARRGIVETAAGFDTPAAAAICSGALDDPSPVVRMAACTVCAQRGGPDAVAQLARRLSTDPDLGVRLRALSSLAETRDEAAVAALVAALDDPDPAITGRAIEGLKRVSGRNLGADPDAWRRWARNPAQTTPRWSMTRAIRQLF